MEITDQLALGIALVGLLGGSGWFKYYLEIRKSKRSEATTVLKVFLYKLQSILNQNKRIQEAIKKDSQFKSLEYSPDYLHENFFSALPETDYRKLAWKTTIENIIEQNEEAVNLIHEYAGDILRPNFRKACNKYIDHASSWSAVWKATIGEQEVPSEMNGAGILLSAAFPEEMDRELNEEIKTRKQEAGL